MSNRTQKIRKQKLDLDLWQNFYYKHQQEYLRKRLLAIKYLWSGKTKVEVSNLLGCTDKTLATWIDKFLEGGLEMLTSPITHQVKQRLNPEQKQELLQIVLSERPTDYGIDRNIWTGKIIAQVISQKWSVFLKDSRIYEILEELNLSYQKAHRDYANSKPEQQKQFVKTLKKSL